MVIEIPRWLDDAIDGQKWTLIGVALLAVSWTGYIAWYVAFARTPPPQHPVAPRTVASCVARPDAALRGETMLDPRCLRDGAAPELRRTAPSR